MVTSLLSLSVLTLAAGPGWGKLIQLQSDLKAESLAQLLKEDVVYPIKTRDLLQESVHKFENPESGDTSQGRKPVGNKTVAIGTEGDIFHDGFDKGFFSTVFRAYAFHWSLRTRPDDWWFTILRTIAIAVDKNSNNPKVRQFFVSHEGKKELVVKVPSLPGTDFDWFFDQMTKQVSENINHPKYVSLARPDFTTTTPTHITVANVAIMSSVQEYFEYVLSIECGIPQIDMLGTREDWRGLLTKFTLMQELLEPIKEILMPITWWDSAYRVVLNLFGTYQEDETSKDWWKDVIEQWGGCGGPPSFSGWFMRDFLGEYEIERAPLGVVTVPLTIDDNGARSEAAVAAGIAGFTVKEEADNVTWIEGNYVWGLMLDPDSYLRVGLV